MVKDGPRVYARARYYREDADEGSFLSAAYSQLVLGELYQPVRNCGIGTICDIGSGLCNNFSALRKMFPSASIIALDLNWKALRAAKTHALADHLIQCDVLALPLCEAQVDLAVCTEVLEHVADLQAAVGEIARVVRTGGHAVVSSPNYFNLMGLRKWFQDLRHGAEYWDPWDGHRGFERLMLPGMMRRAVEPFFAIEQVRGAGYIMAWVPLGYRRMGKINDRFPLVALGRWPLFRNMAMNRYLLLRKR